MIIQEYKDRYYNIKTLHDISFIIIIIYSIKGA